MDILNRQGDIYNAPGTPPQGMTATGGVISDYATPPGEFTEHIFLQDQVLLNVTDDTNMVQT